MRVPERFPYAGELVFTAFSGSHQDAIHKGFTAARGEARARGAELRDLPWTIPYLPIDPEDIGRSYEAMVRINSQSGKGGIAYVMSTWHGLNLPRGLQAEFARDVQALADAQGSELTPESIRRCFEQQYLCSTDQLATYDPSGETASATLYVGGGAPAAHARLSRTIAEAFTPWGIDVHDIHLIGDQDKAAGLDGSIKIYAECVFAGRTFWGAAIDSSALAAAFEAVRVAAARAGRLTAQADHRPVHSAAELTRTPRTRTHIRALQTVAVGADSHSGRRTAQAATDAGSPDRG
jgi:2-isopropylmalate synthase